MATKKQKPENPDQLSLFHYCEDGSIKLQENQKILNTKNKVDDKKKNQF